MKKVVRVFKKVLLLSSAFICLNACKLFTGSLKEYFEYYTGTAAVAKVDYPETCGTTSNGIPCVDSKTDKVFTVYLRNPQKYGPLEDNSGISFYWEFNNKYVDENYYPDIKLNEDCVSATLTFSQAQLVHIDKGDATDTSDGEGRIIKDLSGKIRIFSGITQSYFDGDYELKVMANSAPERIRGAIFQLPEKRVNSPNYIIAFNAYQTKGTVHQNDTHDIYIGKNHWTFTDDIKNLTPVFVEDGCSLSATSPAVQLYDLDDNDSTFESLSSMGYVPLYFTSNKKFATNSEVVSYKISIKDSYGLEASTIVSNQAHELYPPKFISLDSKSIKGESEANDKMAYPAQEETGTFKYVIKHDGSAFYLDADGIPRKGNSTKTPPMIKYQVYQGSTLIKAGDKQSPVVLELPSNKEYYVKAYAYYDGYVDSKETQSMKFAVSRSNKYYVSANAETEGATGSKNNPYSTVQECITAINEDIKNFAKNSEYYIYLLTDMESEKAIIYLQGSNPNSDNYCDSLKGSTVKFIGANGVRKLVAIDETVVSLTNMPEMNVELENLVITSKYGNSNCAGKGIDVSSSNNFNILLENVTVKDCTPESGSAVDCNITGTDGKLTLSNSSVINNTLSSGGYGILVYGSKLHLKNKVVIKDNKIVDYNTKESRDSNIYLPKDGSGNQTVLTLDGALSSGSSIGISTYATPTADSSVIFTKNYGTYNPKVSPSNYFFSDSNIAVAWTDAESQTGEACLDVSKGDIINSLSDISITFATTDEYFIPGKAKTLTVTPTLKISGTERTASTYTNKIGWKTWFTCDGKQIGSANTGTGSTITYTVPASVIYPDIYMLHVQAWYNLDSNHKSQIFDDEFRIITPSEVSKITQAPTNGAWFMNSVDDMKKLKDWSATSSLSSVIFVLTDDINVTQENMKDIYCIGDSSNPFAGTFDGNGHKITLNNLTASSNYTAVFSWVNNARIMNLTVEGDISTSNSNVAAIVCYAEDSDNYIENCINNVNITSSKSYIGGIVGYARNVTIRNCINNGKLVCTQNASADSSGNLGGIVGAIESGMGKKLVIENCVNNGSIEYTYDSTKTRTGGIIGKSEGDWIQAVKNVACIGKVKQGASEMGKVAASSKANFSSCFYFIRSGYGSGKWNDGTDFNQTSVKGSSSLTEIVSNLNNWIDSQPNKTDYKKWKVEGDKIVFSE